MKLQITAQAREILRMKNNVRFLEKLVERILSCLEKLFGSIIYVEIPAYLHEFSEDTLETASAINKISSADILSKMDKLIKPPDEPHCFRYFFLSPSGTRSTGADFLSEKKSIWKAIGELIEREIWYYSDQHYRESSFFASAKELTGKTIDIFNLAAFSKNQKKNFQNLRFDENTRFKWIRVRSLVGNKKVFSPLQLFSAFYFRKNVNKFPEDEKKEPMLRWSVTTGLATGRCLDEAIVKGLLEIVERDSFMITYLNKLSPPKIDLEDLSLQDDDFDSILKSFSRYGLEVHLIEGPTDLPIHVYYAALVDRTGLGPAFCMGASADFDKKTCILDALAESLLVRISLKNNFKEDPKRIDHQGRLLLWSKNENLEKINFLISGKLKKIILGENNENLEEKDQKWIKQYYKEKKEFLIVELEKKELDAYFVELTSKKQALEFRARSVYVIAPEMQPMHLDESIPYFGGQRLRDVPKKLGYEPASELNQFPHPFP